MSKYDEVYEQIKKKYYDKLDGENDFSVLDSVTIKFLIALLLIPLVVLIVRLVASEKIFLEFLGLGIIIFVFALMSLIIYVFMRRDTAGKESDQYLKFRSKYVNTVGIDLLNYYFENVQFGFFDIEEGYKKAGFYLKGTNDFVIHDQWSLVNENENTKLANISVGKITQDEDGSKSYHNLFNGTYVEVDMDILFDFKICVCLNHELYSRMDYLEELEMDYSLFEKFFNVFTDDKISSMQLINSEFLQDITELYKTSPCKFDLVIDGNKLYIRLYIADNLFNVSKLDPIDKNNVIYDMKCLETIKEIIRLVHHYYDTNFLEIG